MSHSSRTLTPWTWFHIICLVAGGLGLLVWQHSPHPDSPSPAAAQRHRAALQPTLTAREQQCLRDFKSKLHERSQSGSMSAADPAWLAMAAARRDVMQRLIREDPARALAEALSWSEWQQLPAAIRDQVEQPFSTTARYSLLPVCAAAADGRGRPVVRVLHLPGSSPVQAFVPAAAAEISSKRQLAVQGIQLGNVAAIDPSPLQILSPADAQAVSHLPLGNPDPTTDLLTGEHFGPSPVTALCGGQRLLFQSLASARAFAEQLTAENLLPSPHHSSASRLAASAPSTQSRPSTQFVSTDPNWTTTKKRAFIIRCDFSDFPSSTFPLPDATSYQAQLNGEISNIIRDFSYGKTWIEATVSPAILRVTDPSTTYTSVPDAITGNLNLYNDVLAQYKAANPTFSETNYDIVGIRFASIGMTISGAVYNGLAEIGGSNVWFQGNATTSVHVHEFGHNYGLDHSNFWQRSFGSTNPTDPNGTDIEYGDPFDVMGSGDAPLASYHADAKHRLKWLGTGEWTSVTTSGTYQIRRIDHASATGSRGLRITRGIDDHYWVSYRRAPDNFHLRSGATLNWRRPGQIKSWLVDATPESIPGSGDKSDATIRIGRTYSDLTANVHITALGRSGSSPSESLSVQVNFGPFPGNVAPTAQLNGPATLSTRQAAVFSITASDANGDSSFAYDWSFSSGNTFDNNSSVVMMWDTPGTYQIRCTVSDMKGGTTTVTRNVTVSEPMSTWTARANTAVGDFYTLLNGSNKLVAAGSGTMREQAFQGPLAFSSNGGATWSAGRFTEFQHAYAGVWDGTRYVMAGGQYAWTTPSTNSAARTPAAYYPAIFSANDVVFSSNTCRFTMRYMAPNGWANQFFWGLAYGNGIYVAVGDNGLIARSTDLTNWTIVNAGISGLISNVAYGNGRFVAVGRSDPYGTQRGFVYTSTDGLNWTDRTSGLGFDNASFRFFWQVVFAHDRFLFSGWNVGLHYSTDGVSFTRARPNTQEFTPAMAYGANMWFASGMDQNNGNASVDLISTDGVNWAKIITPVRADLVNCAAFHNQTFVLAGDRHTLWQGLPVTTSRRNLYTWRETNFPDRDALSVPLADADGDGVSNLMEYVFDTPPLGAAAAASSSPLPVASRVSDNPLLADRIALQFSVPDPAPGDLTFIIEAASSLTGSWSTVATKTGNAPWVWSAGGTSRIVTGPSSNGRTSVTVGDSQSISSSPGRFMRMKTATAQ